MNRKSFLSLVLVCATGLLTSVGTANAQRLFLMVNRDSGEVQAVSSADVQIDAYSIKSPSGNLDPETWNSLTDQGAEGWTEAQPRTQQLSELNWPSSGTLSAGQPVRLGNAYAGSGLAPSEEDLRFEYGTPDGVFGVGEVRYTGAPQVPALLVDRRTGQVKLSNPQGFEIGGYSIISDDGSLLPDGLTGGLADQGLEGWFEANLAPGRLSELSLEQSHVINAANPLVIGNAFATGATEDLEFEYLTVDGLLSDGDVFYSGAVSDFTLQIDLISGEATLANITSDAVDLIGYSVLSASEGLSVDNWSAFASEGWIAANPNSAAIAELNPSGSKTIAAGDSISLGNIFVGIEQDLVLEYSTSGGVAQGTVDYQLILGGPTCADIAASRAIPGDLDGSGDVAFADFLVLSANFGGAGGVGYEQGDIDCNGSVAFADFLVLSANFGQSAAAEAASVPEPASGLPCLFAALGLLATRRMR